MQVTSVAVSAMKQRQEFDTLLRDMRCLLLLTIYLHYIQSHALKTPSTDLSSLCHPFVSVMKASCQAAELDSKEGLLEADAAAD